MVPIVPRGLLASFDTIARVSATSPVLDIIIMRHHVTFPFLAMALMRLTRCVNHADRGQLYQSEICIIDHVCSLA